ncbi:MAG TPA: hypothetical protein VHL79_20930, partial [Ramlibacter sp.]|nr:hypothetical protein [Ramlibacter sp.]
RDICLSGVPDRARAGTQRVMSRAAPKPDFQVARAHSARVPVTAARHRTAPGATRRQSDAAQE